LKNSDDKAAPEKLSPEAQAWSQLIVEEYGIRDAAGRLLLLTALEAFDRMRQAQAAIREDGATVLDRFGQVKAHPLLTVERDARGQMLSALRSLNLDIEVK